MGGRGLPDKGVATGAGAPGASGRYLARLYKEE